MTLAREPLYSPKSPSEAGFAEWERAAHFGLGAYPFNSAADPQQLINAAAKSVIVSLWPSLSCLSKALKAPPWRRHR
jgi:hypothetical protein